MTNIFTHTNNVKKKIRIPDKLAQILFNSIQKYGSPHIKEELETTWGVGSEVIRLHNEARQKDMNSRIDVIVRFSSNPENPEFDIIECKVKIKELIK